jgi:hypothetical protein
MARTAGLLSIAVLGSLVIITFRGNLEKNISSINIPEKKKKDLINNSGKLAETQPPEGLSKEKTNQINKVIKISFVKSFDFILYISAALTWLGSLIAAATVKKEIKPPPAGTLQD